MDDIIVDNPYYGALKLNIEEDDFLKTPMQKKYRLLQARYLLLKANRFYDKRFEYL